MMFTGDCHGLIVPRRRQVWLPGGA